MRCYLAANAFGCPQAAVLVFAAKRDGHQGPGQQSYSTGGGAPGEARGGAGGALPSRESTAKWSQQGPPPATGGGSTLYGHPHPGPRACASPSSPSLSQNDKLAQLLLEQLNDAFKARPPLARAGSAAPTPERRFAPLAPARGAGAAREAARLRDAAVVLPPHGPLSGGAVSAAQRDPQLRRQHLAFESGARLRAGVPLPRCARSAARRAVNNGPRRRPPLPQSDPAACEWLRPPAPAVVAGAAGKHHRDDEPADGVDDLQPSAVRCGAVHLRMAQRAGVPRLERPHLRRWRVRGALRVPHVWPERMRARLRHRRAHVAAHHLGVLELHCARLPTRLPLRRCGPHPTAPARARHWCTHAPLAAGRCSARRSVVAKRSPPPRAARRQASATATLGQSEFYKGSGWNLCLFNTTTCWWTLPQQFNGSQAFSTTLAVPDGDWVFVLVAPYGGLFGNVTSMASPSVTNVSSFSVCRIGAPQCRPHHAATTTFSCPSSL